MLRKSFIELVAGNLDEKREYRQMIKRVKALPKDYRYVYKKIMNYSYNFGFYLDLGEQLLEFLEESSSAGRPAFEVIGSDAAAFCDELIRNSISQSKDSREKLNCEIADHFRRKEQESC